MGNLSQTRRAEMLEYLNHLKEIHTDDESRIALGKIETALTEKKYGLVWEEHEEEVDKKLVHNIPVFKEVEERKIVADESNDFNFLLEGDNLHSLKLLEKTHKGKIDVIYIDPPYNTGAKDWKYNNDFVDDKDTFRHSKWLSFMNERLIVSRDLLSEKGIIAVSIDHFELSQLIILMDTIFGEHNRIGIITVVHKPEGRNQEKFFGTSNEFCLFYAKDKNKASFSGQLIMTDPSEFKYIDEKGPYTLKNFIRLTDGKYATKEAKPNFYYPIYVDPQNKVATTDYNEKYKEVYPITDKGVKRTWKTLPKTFNEYNKLDNIEVIVNGDRTEIYEKQRPFEVIRTHWIKKEYHSYHYGTKILTNILGRKSFDFPKSVILMKDIIKLLSNKNSIILDFFAGSGTTGQAVMELNKEDGGNRKFILCTNNENNICEDITYERLSKVIKGYEFSGKIKKELKSYNLDISNLKKIDAIFQEFEEIKSEKKEDYDKFSNQSKGGVLKLIGEKEELDKVVGIPHNLKYYKTEFIPKLLEDEEILSSKLLDYIKEMVELENMCEIDGNTRRIILSDEDLNIALTEMEESGVLYIPSFILLTNEIKDSIEERKLEVVTIPDYYFTEELREVNEL